MDRKTFEASVKEEAVKQSGNSERFTKRAIKFVARIDAGCRVEQRDIKVMKYFTKFAKNEQLKLITNVWTRLTANQLVKLTDMEKEAFWQVAETVKYDW